MPVFFFDIHSGNELSIDDEGMELRAFQKKTSQSCGGQLKANRLARCLV